MEAMLSEGCRPTWPLQGHGDALESSVTLLHMFLWSLMWAFTMKSTAELQMQARCGPQNLTLLHCTGARSPPTLEDALAAAAGTPASSAETLSGSGGLSASQDPSPGPELLAKAPGKPARPRSPGKGDSPSGAGSSGEMLGQFKVGTPLQEVERAWNLGLATGWGDSRGSGAGSGGDSGAAGHSRSSLVSDMSGLSASGSVLGPGLGPGAPHALQSDSKGLRRGRGALPGLPRPAGDLGAAGQAMAQDGNQVCTGFCVTLGRLKQLIKVARHRAARARA